MSKLYLDVNKYRGPKRILQKGTNVQVLDPLRINEYDVIFRALRHLTTALHFCIKGHISNKRPFIAYDVITCKTEKSNTQDEFIKHSACYDLTSLLRRFILINKDLFPSINKKLINMIIEIRNAASHGGFIENESFTGTDVKDKMIIIQSFMEILIKDCGKSHKRFDEKHLIDTYKVKLIKTLEDWENVQEHINPCNVALCNLSLEEKKNAAEFTLQHLQKNLNYDNNDIVEKVCNFILTTGTSRLLFEEANIYLQNDYPGCSPPFIERLELNKDNN